MTQPLHIEETTKTDLAAIMFPGHQYSSLAKAGVDFFIKQQDSGNITTMDVGTLRTFIDFLIKNKGYN